MFFPFLLQYKTLVAGIFAFLQRSENESAIYSLPSIVWISPFSKSSTHWSGLGSIIFHPVRGLRASCLIILSCSSCTRWHFEYPTSNSSTQNWSLVAFLWQSFHEVFRRFSLILQIAYLKLFHHRLDASSIVQ